MVLDKDFTYDGNIISAGTDIAKFEGVTVEVPYNQPYVRIDFSAVFFDKALFDTDIYNFEMKVKSDDNINFINNMNFVIDTN